MPLMFKLSQNATHHLGHTKSDWHERSFYQHGHALLSFWRLWH